MEGMVLQFESGRTIDSPSYSDLVNGMPFEVFSRLQIAEDVFLQCHQGEERTGRFTLEYREGSDGQFLAEGDFAFDRVLRAFNLYLTGDRRWKDGFRWQRLDMNESKLSTILNTKLW
jgi:hypothetical protein